MKELIEYSMILTLLNLVYRQELVSKQEYDRTKLKLMSKYNIVSEITAR